MRASHAHSLCSFGLRVRHVTPNTRHSCRLPLLLCCFLLLAALPVPCSLAKTSDVLQPDNFGYAVRIAVPRHEKAVAASGFYYRDDGSLYVVTARHVLFAATQVEIKEGGAFPIPRQLIHRIKYDAKGRLLSLEGVLSSQERDAMLQHPSVTEDGRRAIEYLYEKSQKLRLKGHTAIVATCLPGTGELELGLTRMLAGGFIKYHPVQDVAVIKLGNEGKCGADMCTGFLPEVRVKKPGDVLALDAAHVGLLTDVAVGSTAFVFGYDAPTANQQPPQRGSPMLRKTSVVGKSKELGLIMLDGVAHPGDSGGLALEVDQASPGNGFKGIGVVSSAFHLEKEKEGRRNYSLAVALDAVLDLLRK